MWCQISGYPALGCSIQSCGNLWLEPLTFYHSLQPCFCLASRENSPGRGVVSSLTLCGSVRAGAGVSSGPVVPLSTLTSHHCTVMIRDNIRRSLTRPTPPIPIGPVGSFGSVFGFCCNIEIKLVWSVVTAQCKGIKQSLSCPANALRSVLQPSFQWRMTGTGTPGLTAVSVCLGKLARPPPPLSPAWRPPT